MTSKNEETTLSRIELVVLARFTSPKNLTEGQLGADLGELGQPHDSATLNRTIQMLVGKHLLVEAPQKSKPKKGAAPKLPFQVTERGNSALRAAFSLVSTPRWSDVRSSHLPALALGLAPGSHEASQVRRGFPISMIRIKLKMPQTASLNTVCDDLLLQKLGLPRGKVTLATLRAQVLARELGVQEITTTKTVAENAVKKWLSLETQKLDKKLIETTLVRRWISGQVNHWLSATESSAASPKVQTQANTSPPSPETLLAVVRDVIPRVSAEGRFGSEKVFVSAIWRDVEKDRRISTLPLDFFKRWLLKAMRAGDVRLARADLVAAMDLKLVAESEIQDQGATFHFVLDQRNGSQGADRRNHA